MTVQGLSSASSRPAPSSLVRGQDSVHPAGDGDRLEARAVAPVRSRRVDLSQERELGMRQWWRLHTGHLRHDRGLSPAHLVQRILYKRKEGKGEDAATLLNQFFQRIRTSDGESCVCLARHYAQAGSREDALDLYRAAESCGALSDAQDVLCMAQLLIDVGEAGDAVGLIAGHQILAPTDPRLATWSGIAWLARACEVSPKQPEFFATAQERALKSLRMAARLEPTDPQLADNIAATEALYPGPFFGNIAKAFDSPFLAAPNLRAVLIAALQQHVDYSVRRTMVVGTAVRQEIKHYRRQENVDAVRVLQQA